MSKLTIYAAAVALSVSLGAVQAHDYARGAIVRLAPQADGEPLPVSRVIAVPGDRIQVIKSAILVNGEPVQDVSAEMLAQLATEGWDQNVQAGHYVVIGERKGPSGTVRYSGLVPAKKIVGTVDK